MTDPRPRPQYGEYATPEEQAKAMGGADAAAGVNAEDLSAESTTAAPAFGTSASSDAVSAAGPAPTPASTSTPTVPAAPPANTEQIAAKPTTPGAGRPRRIWDSVLTAVLLGIGIIMVTSSIPQYANFGATLDQVWAQLGGGEYPDRALAATIGIALNITQIVLYVAGAAIALLMVRRNRLAFIYPLIAGVLFIVVAVVLSAVALAADPTLLDTLSAL